MSTLTPRMSTLTPLWSYPSGIRLALRLSHASKLWRCRVQFARRVEAPRAAEVGLEVTLELKHVAHVVRAREPEAAVHLRRDVVVANGLADRLAERRRHLRAGQVAAGDADGLAGHRLASLEDAERATSDILGGDAGKLLVTHGHRDAQHAVGPLLRTQPEVDEIVPVERGQQDRRRHAGLDEEPVRLALRIKVRDLVTALQRRHPVVRERHPLARVFQRGPDHVLQAGRLRRGGHGFRLRQFLLGRHVVPEEGHAVRTVRPGKGLRQALGIVDVRRHDLRAQRRKRPGLFAGDVPGNGPRGEAAGRIGHDGPHQAAALCSRRAHDGDDLFLCHSSESP